MSEEAMQRVAELAAEKAIERYHADCHFDDPEERKKLHAFSENTTPGGAAMLGKFGKWLESTEAQVGRFVILGILLLVLGLVAKVDWTAAIKLLK